MRIRMIGVFFALAAFQPFGAAMHSAPALAQRASVFDEFAAYRITDRQIDNIAAAVKAKATHDDREEAEEAGGGNTPFFRGDWMNAQPALLKLALAGNIRAALGLGQIYDRGFDLRKGAAIFGHIDPDLPHAVRLIRVAAEAGDLAGLRRMSELYAQGHGVPKDEALAKEWDARYRSHPFFATARTECRPMPQCLSSIPK